MAFQKGQIANPNGRPKQLNQAVALARKYTESAMNVLVRQLASEKEEIAHKAAIALIDRAWGKPAEVPPEDAPDNTPTVLGFTREELKLLLDEIRSRGA